MSIHREGLSTLLIVFSGLTLLCLAVFKWFPQGGIFVLAASIGLFLFFLQFFRHPNRPLPKRADDLLYAPADGKVVVIEETEETEYFHDRRLQVSIFMSPLNVHVNRVPVSGTVRYFQYHPGKYLVAWHPKSSTENERSTIVIQHPKGEVLIRQIAGAVARRICTYPKTGQEVNQGEELGFIKFGSRVDVFLPIDTKLKVEIGQKVKANVDVIGTLARIMNEY